MSTEPFASAGADASPAQPSAYLDADARDGSFAGKDSLTIDEAAWQLIRGEPGWSGALRTPFEVTYAYRATAPSTMPDDTGGFQRFNSAQIAQSELAIQAWEDVASIRFTRVGAGLQGEGAYSDQASILLGGYQTGADGAAAFSYYPGRTAASSSAGDVWLNVAKGYSQSPTIGNYGAMVIVHELGHAIGLAHPGDYNADANTSFSYAADGAYYEDSRQYTVMSYFSEANTGGSDAGAYAAAPLLDDIAAAQLEYGANLTTRTGDTVYGFNSTADRPWFSAISAGSRLVFAVWDAGGVDTFDFSGYASAQKIELREGFFSNVGGLVGNVAVAQGAQIENAIGGIGADTIEGNELANVLVGGAGGDSLNGFGGDDVLRGGDGSNVIRGGAGNDRLEGGADNDDLQGNTGADTETGGAGNDWVVGGQDNDQLFGNEAGDIVYGNLGDDLCDGGAGDDLVRGGQGNDTVLGGTGGDWLSGDRGDDTITGGLGPDVFHSFGQAGLDYVTDFNLAEGDRVQLDPGTSYTVVEQGADTVVLMSEGRLVLAGVHVAATASNWLFVA